MYLHPHTPELKPSEDDKGTKLAESIGKQEPDGVVQI
jgi:hypothetical protein